MKKILFLAGPPALSVALLFWGLNSDSGGLGFLIFGIPLVLAFCFFWLFAVGIALTSKNSSSQKTSKENDHQTQKSKPWDSPLDHFAIALICYSLVLFILWNSFDVVQVLRLLGLGIFGIFFGLFGFPLAVILAGFTAAIIHFVRKNK